MDGGSTGLWEFVGAPRRWQLGAFHAWKEAGHHGIAEVVTGAGKTAFALQCMADFHRRTAKPRFIIVVPTLVLADQWYVSLREELGVPDSDIAVYSGEHHPNSPAIVNVIVINTARHLSEQLAAGHESFLIVDECHRAGSFQNSQALRGVHQATLGISATPHREYDLGFQEYLIPTLGPIIYVYSYNDAVRDGVIVPFDLVNVAVALEPQEQDAYNSLTRKVALLLRRLAKDEPVQGPLKNLLRQRASVSANARMRLPAAIALTDQHRGIRTLIFHERIQAADSLFAALRARQHSVTIYHSGIGPVTRRDNLRLYRRGVFTVLVTCRALDEGMNVPETAIGIIASSTASSRQRIQRLGRVLRPAPGKGSATVFTLYATEIEQKRLAKEANVLVGANSITWLTATVGQRNGTPSR